MCSAGWEPQPGEKQGGGAETHRTSGEPHLGWNLSSTLPDSVMLLTQSYWALISSSEKYREFLLVKLASGLNMKKGQKIRDTLPLIFFPIELLELWYFGVYRLIDSYSVKSIPLKPQLDDWIPALLHEFSHSVMSNSLWPHGLRHTRLPCPSQTYGVYSTHVHRVSDAIQPSHPLSFPSPSIFNPSQHQGIFQWASSSHQLAKVFEFQPQHQSFQWIFRTDFLLGWTGWISLQSKGLSRVFSNTTVQKHQFFGAQLSLWSNSHIHTWVSEKP